MNIKENLFFTQVRRGQTTTSCKHASFYNCADEDTNAVMAWKVALHEITVEE